MGVFDMISSFLNPQRGYEAAGDVARQRWQEAQDRYNQAQGYLTPYSQQGQEQYGRLNEGINQLLNPEGLMSRFISGYQESPYTKQLLEQNRQRGLEGASSMGLMGSSAALGNIQQGAGAIANSQREQYLKDLMSNYMSGLGLSSDIYKTGAGSAGELLKGALGMGELGQKEGEFEAGTEFGRENAPGDLLNNWLKTALNAYTSSQTGGAGFLH